MGDVALRGERIAAVGVVPGRGTLELDVTGLEELERMRALVRSAMDEGALGVGSSLIYAPAFHAGTDELVALCEATNPHESLKRPNPPLPGACILWLENTTGLPAESGILRSGGSRVGMRFQEGRANVASLAPGEYRLSASFADVVVEPAEIELGSDRSHPIELTWRRRE